MRRCSILEGVDEEAKLCHGTLGGESEYLKHLLLEVTVVDTQTSTAYLHTVAHEVVGLGPHSLGMLLKQRYVIRVGHGERMVCRHEPLLLIAPLK